MTVAIYGGTFDPIHIGHLRAALELKERLGARQVHLIPSNTPPHRDIPGATVEQRLEMLRLAVQGVEGLIVDDREVRRQGVSYTIDTLMEFAEQLDKSEPRYFVVGEDAFELIETWHRWQALTDYAHLVVISRPGYERKQESAAVLEWLQERQIADLNEAPLGNVIRMVLPNLEVSASGIRARCRDGKSIDYLVPATVESFIELNALYR